MIKVSILGYGNLGRHLVSALKGIDRVSLIQVYSRNQPPVPPDGINLVGDLSELSPCDLLIAAVSDDALSALSEQLPKDVALVHTSGTVDIDALGGQEKRGVFYPLQTFSKDRAVSFKNIPICLESNHPELSTVLENLGHLLSNQVVWLNSTQRRQLHFGAVLVNNFGNHLYSLTEDYLNQHELPFELLHPLIEETAKKAIAMSPQKAQTGPAKRGDRDTINRHLSEITDEELQEIYKLLTASISRKYKPSK